MKLINKIHHVALIVSDYEVSKRFYVDILGMTIKSEVYREERKSYKLDLEVNNHYQIELFSFENPPERPSYPEACGLRHLAFETDSVCEAKDYLEKNNIVCEEIRTDEFTGKRFFFISDPDMLPIEFYEK